MATRSEIQFNNKGWGNALTEDILKVLESATELFQKNIQPEVFNSKKIIIQNSSFHDPPIDHPCMYKRDFQNWIFLSVQDKLWAKYAYQFSHEFCHHLIESDFINSCDQFGWFEESLCELASIHSIKNMAQTWTIKPPYSNWKEYAKSLNEYANEILFRESNRIEIPLSSWINDNIEQLSRDRYQREKNCLVATHISDVFFENPNLWNTICYINKINVVEDMFFEEFLDQWIQLVPETNLIALKSLKEQLIN